MEIGMLWYDDSPISLKENVKRAASYYAEKYGRKPNLCLVHPGMLKSDEVRVNGVQIRKGKGVMRGHLWIGVNEARVRSNGKKARQKPQSRASSKSTATKSKPKTNKAKSNTSRVKTSKAKTAKAKATKPKTSKPKTMKVKAKAPKRA